jgi:hypothetical protein
MYGYWSSVAWPVCDCTVSYRPVLSSKRAPYRKKNKAIVTIERIRIKSGHGLEKGSPIPRRTGRLTVGRKINSTQLNSRSLQVRGVSRIWTIKYGLESREIQTRAATVNYRPILSSERALQNNKLLQLSNENLKEKKILVTDPRWA